MNKNYDLLNGLFQQTSNAKANIIDEADKAKPTTKRTWKIFDDVWEEFVALAALKKITQAELINELIQNAVEENREEIQRYIEFFGHKH